ncbi:galactosylceramide sulfotransferase-like [Saccoglossus kowalevskii]|uniref:Galactosylceramide sulfotransferase-like n=1 Tax=Saccoglossus kowalevskii TaxID=10224 RepID=A0ABM0MZW7_SACKO|nr:PREDICTED: galactosylceramide sulfotransferase-like [Saccoglossus kowalevskii]
MSLPQCEPVSKFIFIKTLKTGSSTTGSILYRYGITNKLISPVYQKWILPVENGNNLDIIGYNNCSNFTGFNYFSHHSRLNRSLMDDAIPGAKYFTILRSPYTQLESVFSWFNCGKELSHFSDPFLEYVQHNHEFLTSRDNCFHQQRNGQMWSMGFDQELQENETYVQLKIKQIDQEVDLVMLLEYYDESLILLKKLMCWRDEDLIYYSTNVRSSRTTLTPVIRDTILKRNRADIMLYEYFNSTFWQKVRDYDGNFEIDLQQFRSKVKLASNRCLPSAIEVKGSFCWQLYNNVPQLRKYARTLQSEWLNC